MIYNIVEDHDAIHINYSEPVPFSMTMRSCIVSFFFVFLLTQFVKRSVDYNIAVFTMQYGNYEEDSNIYSQKERTVNKVVRFLSIILTRNFPVSLTRDFREDKSDLYRASSYFQRTVPNRGPNGFFCWNTEDTGCNYYYIHDVTLIILLLTVTFIFFIGTEKMNQDFLQVIQEIKLMAQICCEVPSNFIHLQTKRKKAHKECRWHLNELNQTKLHQCTTSV